MPENSHTARQYVLASDFDQTLSFNDTGIVLSELLGISGFREKVAGLSRLMPHMNHRGGLTIAASEAKYIAQIAKRTIVSDGALSVLVPIMEEIVRYEPSQIRALFEGHGFLIQEWDKVRTDWLTIQESSTVGVSHLRVVAQA
jgi:hypothetical protein